MLKCPLLKRGVNPIAVIMLGTALLVPGRHRLKNEPLPLQRPCDNRHTRFETKKGHGISVLAGRCSLLNQPPVTWVPYASNPQSIASKQLPNAGQGGPMAHLYLNSDAIAQTTLKNTSSDSCGGYPCNVPESQWGASYFQVPPHRNDFSPPIYYATDRDPWYKFGQGCHYNPNLPLTYFRAPSGAKFSTTTVSDQSILIWDQTNHKIIEMYTHSSTTPALPPSSCFTSTVCAVEANPNNFACDVTSDSGTDWGRAPTNPNGFHGWATLTREQELMQGQINHAMMGSYQCTNANNQYVWPSHTSAGTCGVLIPGVPNSATRPPNGALLFLDYTDDQIDAMNIPTLQKTVIRAMAHYGVYLNVTGPWERFSPVNHEVREGSEAWQYYGLTDPFFAWLQKQPGVSCPNGISPGSQCSYYAFSGIPKNIPGPTCSTTLAASDQCGIDKHIHVADPCVAEGLAGLPGGCR